MRGVARLLAMCHFGLLSLAACAHGPAQDARQAEGTTRTLAACGVVPSTNAGHICWIDRVVAKSSGVRVFFMAGAPGRPRVEGTYAALGGKLSLSNSGHDSCTISVERDDGQLGVRAESFLYVPHITPEPETRTEWIAAVPAY